MGVAGKNYEKLKKYLLWAKKYNKKNSLSLKGFWTYDYDYFSNRYIRRLTKNDVIVINRDLGKKIDPETIDCGKEKPSFDTEIRKIVAENISAPWYYKGEGKLMTTKYYTDYYKKHFHIEKLSEIFGWFPITKQILQYNKPEPGKIIYEVHADWWGAYFMMLASLTGRKFNEVTFTTDELYKLRDFLLKEKPKGCILSCVTSDRDCRIHDIDLAALLNQFDYPGIDYLKFLSVSKAKIIKAPANKHWPRDAMLFFSDKKEKSPKYISVPYFDGKVIWVLAYVK